MQAGGGKDRRTTTRLLAAAWCGFILLAGCATSPGSPPGSELIGATLRMQAASGDVTTLRFSANGIVRATFNGRSVSGRWTASQRRLCFFWSGAPRECWPYRTRFERGRTRTLTSDRRNIVRVTML